jgi:hypothetical protein
MEEGGIIRVKGKQKSVSSSTFRMENAELEHRIGLVEDADPFMYETGGDEPIAVVVTSSIFTEDQNTAQGQT